MSSKKCMLTLSTAFQVNPIRIGVSYDQANGKGRPAVLKEVLKCKVKPVRSNVCYGSANEKGRLVVSLQSQLMRRHDSYDTGNAPNVFVSQYIHSDEVHCL